MPKFIQDLFPSTRPLRAAALAVLAGFALAGCGKRSEISAYTAPKDVEFNPDPAPSTGHGGEWRPAVKYTLPTGWTDLGAKDPVLARFKAGDVEIAIIPLTPESGSFAGKESGLVNFYRSQRNQPPLDDAAMAKVLLDTPIGEGVGKYFEIVDPKEDKVGRFVLAFAHRAQGSIFFSLDGEDAAVQALKPAFFEFLKTVRITDDGGAAPAPPPQPEAVTPPAPPVPAAGLPTGWTQMAHGQFQIAKFQVPEVNGAKAEVAVSVFPSDTGGTAANINRWRQQLGLAAVSDTEAVALAKSLEGAPSGSLLVHLENGAAAISGAIIPRANQWFFYKLTGDTPAVQAARESFTSFAKSPL